MFTKLSIGYTFLALLASTGQVLGREKWLERDNRAVFLYPRRFGQEQPAVLAKLREACPGQVCGNLAGQAVTPLLAAQPECSQQDLADAIIDASKQFDAATQANMIAIAKEYRQAEKNTPPDFTTNPPTARNSVFCQKAPKNPELNGLVQAQDPANDPNIFFDPALKASVTKGSQANTAPFNGGAAAPAAPAPAATTEAPATGTAILIANPAATDTTCVTAITVTVTATNGEATATDAITVSVGDVATTTADATAASPTATAAPVPAGADFGSCTTPQIEFGVGFDNRKETSFQPVDKQSFNHGSAQNINIITQFICDTLTNSCKANQAAKDICATASAAATGTGAQADAFNAAFGISTQFVNVASVDNQGKIVPGTGASTGSGAVTTSAAGNAVGGNTLVASPSASAAPIATALPSTGSTGSSIGNFGSCTVPEIEFGAGFDGRKETSFQPKDKQSFNHGSAQNIDIITRAICDTLVNSCNADATAKATCATATAAASAAAKGTGAQADAFNAAFGINTNFALVAQIDNQGRVAGGNTAAAPAVTTTAAAAATPVTTAAASANTVTASTGGAATAGNLQTFAGALGGVVAPTVTDLGNGQFQVTGNSAFNSKSNALVRSCDVQNNLCANAANSSGNKNGFTVAACNAQQATCISQANSA
ncbi:hypothetical protein BDQ12DRAFT_664848 [Crucibulum laeve]|uniref:Uncharacterized protein n=1 Tax=Crucibulum laeve TaxID=68775 RepID=A0A5C3M964_9AGAR|nr:hypothetical protein BDQ12DRAFT_664848 [Crucibulum laeve]